MEAVSGEMGSHFAEAIRRDLGVSRPWWKEGSCFGDGGPDGSGAAERLRFVGAELRCPGMVVPAVALG